MRSYTECNAFFLQPCHSSWFFLALSLSSLRLQLLFFWFLFSYHLTWGFLDVFFLFFSLRLCMCLFLTPADVCCAERDVRVLQPVRVQVLFFVSGLIVRHHGCANVHCTMQRARTIFHCSFIALVNFSFRRRFVLI